MTTTPDDLGLLLDLRLEALSDAVNALDAELFDFLSDHRGTAERAQVLITVKAIAGELKLIQERAQGAVSEAMGGLPEYVLEDGTTIEKKWSSDRKGWRHAEIAAVVASHIQDLALDLETGELLKTTEEMIRELLTYAGVGYWKVKELDRIGISANDYCEVGDAKPSIIVRRPKL